MDEIRNFLTIRDTAHKLDISEESVRDLIKVKQLRAVKIGQWRINPVDLETFIKSRMNF
ncbi:MAG TPA: helix-turn-helix domain-containing protein [Hanamia sp.]